MNITNQKRVYVLLVLTMFVLTILVSCNFVIAQPDWPSFNVCCERTTSNAWCQNTLQENCDESFRISPTSCDATSFCKLGCCVDTEEGLCMENTPEKVCEISAGSWFNDEECKLPQCDLGCCLIGDQASFVTLTRCKRLSSFYALETDFRRNINNEASCIALAYFQDKGACVYDFEGIRTCKFTTRAECIGSEKGNVSDIEFFKDFLCSADELATDCGPTTDTTCVDGKEEVYFLDSCGNTANIYDSNKIYGRDPSYWQKIVLKADSCGFGNEDGNAGSKTCGNCEYFQGSICAKGAAAQGENACKDLNCYNTENGEDYKNGESWCIYQGPVGRGDDYVGSRHFRHVCINGEETVEPCADFRNEVCIENVLETSGGDFVEAACRVNRYESCMGQTDEEDCLNLDKRDCYWFEGVHFEESLTNNLAAEGQQQTFNALSASGNSEAEQREIRGVLSGDEICLPDVPAGETKTCGMSNSVCTVTFEEDLFGGKDCKKNCECLTQEWVQQMNTVCTALGDCGAYYNLAGEYTKGGAVWKHQGEKKVIQGILQRLK